MDDVEPVIGARIASRAMQTAKTCAKREPPNAPHTVDADTHDTLLQGIIRVVPPISSSRTYGHAVDPMQGKTREEIDPTPDQGDELV
jgi:hypothetical protein